MLLEPNDAVLEAGESIACSQTVSCRDFTFVAMDDEVEFAATACSEVLKSANRLLGTSYYRWRHVVGLDNFPDQMEPGSGHALVLIGGSDTPWVLTPADKMAIRKHLRLADRLCIVGSAVFVPISCGFRHSQPVAVHPNFQTAIAELAWQPEFAPFATCHARSLSSATSGIAAIQMMLELVSQQNGEFTGNALAEYLGLNKTQAAAYSSLHWRYLKKAQGDTSVRLALELMSDHLEDTLSIHQIADLLDISPRHLERCFGDLLNLSPLKVYRALRLDRARNLLAQTNLTLTEVSVACGFTSSSNMAKWYRHRYAELPKETRKKAYNGRIGI